MQHPQQQQLKQPVPWRRLVIGGVVTLLLLLAGLTLLLSIGHVIDGIWSYLLPIALTITAILVPFWQALFPPSANQPASATIPTVSPNLPTPAPTPTISPVSSTTNSPLSQSTPAVTAVTTTQSPPLPNIFYFNAPHLPNI